jgi:hypothetical protein
MKRFSFFFLLLVIIGVGVSAEISLSGEANTYLNVFPGFPYTSDRFDTPVNPENITGIQDVALDTDVTFRLDAGREAGALTLWLAVNPYEMSRLLQAAATTDPLAEGLLLSDPAALSVLRANIAWFIGQALVLRLGRQSMLTGYGYGWNPMDFANTVKDPFDPQAELRGVDALSLQFYLGNLFALKLAGILTIDELIAGADYKELKATAELTVTFPLIECSISGLYEYDGEDAFVPAFGAGFMSDVAGVGIYGEGALLWGGRIPVAVGVSNIERPEQLFASGLIGLEYTFASELRLIAEYLYNGEGYSRQERDLYRQSLEDQFASLTYIPGEYAAMYRPGYFARHYLLLNLGYPIYRWNTNVEFATYYSPDSGALGVLPSLELEVSGSLSVRAGYSGLFSLLEDQYDEAWFSPVKHIAELRLTYFF